MEHQKLRWRWICLPFVAFLTYAILMIGEFFTNLTKRHHEMQDELSRVQKEIDVIMCNEKHVGRTGGFCLDPQQVFDGFNQIWSGQLCGAVEAIAGESSIVDFGAGLGHYGRCLLRMQENIIKTQNVEELKYLNTSYHTEMKNGNLVGKKQVVKSYTGIDGALNIEDLSNGFITFQDLSAPIDLGKMFDYVLCIEVGEHIPHEYESIFIDNLCKHACKGVMLSWAVEGQVGHNHINNHNHNYVITQMMARDWIYDDAASLKIIGESYVPVMVFRPKENKC